jgi:cob(I)alamin adenosyltransferase
VSEEEINERHRVKTAKIHDARARMMEKKTREGGLLMVHTGTGKGKSTAAFGMVIRALGWDMKVGVVQFVKGAWKTGEAQFFAKFPDLLTFEVMGEGFTWDTQDRERDIAAARKAWTRGLEMLHDPSFDFVLFDELNIVLRNDYLDLAEVIAGLKARPEKTHVCVTGRNAKPELIEIADLVTDFTLVRHPFQNGFKVQKGVDF